MAETTRLGLFFHWLQLASFLIFVCLGLTVISWSPGVSEARVVHFEDGGDIMIPLRCSRGEGEWAVVGFVSLVLLDHVIQMVASFVVFVAELDWLKCAPRTHRP
jgi:hypothetical protein